MKAWSKLLLNLEYSDYPVVNIIYIFRAFKTHSVVPEMIYVIKINIVTHVFTCYFLPDS